MISRSPVSRLREALPPGVRPGWVIPILLLAGIPPAVAMATRLDMLPIALGLVAVALTAVVGFRWPLLPLLVFAVFVPIEEVVFIDGIGTISRLAAILFAIAYGAPRIGRLTFGMMPPAAWAYLAWAVVSLGWAIDPGIAWGELATLVQLFLIAFLVADYVVHQPSVVRLLLWAYCLSAAATALIGVADFIQLGAGDTVRAAAISNQNPAQFAAILLPAFAFGLHEIVSGKRRILGGTVALLTALGIVVSGTRGAWVAAAVVLILLILQEADLRRRIVAIAAVVALVAAVYQFPGVSGLVAERAGNAVSTGGAGRTDIWSIGAEIYESAPVLGVGYANFPVAYTPDIVRQSNVSYTRAGRAPHNLVVGTLVELGPIGLTLLALFLGPLVLRRGWGPDAAVIQAALASLLTMALTLDILGNRKQVWLVIGIGAGLAYLKRRNDQGTDQIAAAGAGPDGDPGQKPRAGIFTLTLAIRKGAVRPYQPDDGAPHTNADRPRGGRAFNQ